MGTNGSGKSTLSKCLVGHPDYEITGGSGAFTLTVESANLKAEVYYYIVSYKMKRK